MEDFQEVECLYRLTSACPLHEKKKSAACVIRAEQRSRCSSQDKRPSKGTVPPNPPQTSYPPLITLQCKHVFKGGKIAPDCF